MSQNKWKPANPIQTKAKAKTRINGTKTVRTIGGPPTPSKPDDNETQPKNSVLTATRASMRATTLVVAITLFCYWVTSQGTQGVLCEPTNLRMPECTKRAETKPAGSAERSLKAPKQVFLAYKRVSAASPASSSYSAHHHLCKRAHDVNQNGNKTD